MTFGNTKEALEARKVLKAGDIVISERAYNLIIGGMLLWGFLLNMLTVKLLGGQVVDYVRYNGSSALVIGYLVSAIIGTILVAVPHAVVSFIGYNLIAIPVGILLCVVVDGIDPSVISTAALFTAIITGVFIIISAIRPDFFLSMGRALLVSAGLLIVGEAVFMLIGADDLALCWLGAGLFGMFIGFDWARCSVCACTLDNAVDAAANLYLDIINLFLRVLRILAASKRKD